MAFANNNLGQVVGYASTRSREGHAFLWEKGPIRDIVGDDSMAMGINDLKDARSINNRGQVVGNCTVRRLLSPRLELAYLMQLPPSLMDSDRQGQKLHVPQTRARQR